MKQKKEKINNGLLIGMVIIIILGALTFGLFQILTLLERLQSPEANQAITSVIVPRKAEAKELSMKEWVKQEIEKAGLSWEKVNSIIECESNWRDDICIIEPNMTISCGLWQLNTVHNKKGLTNACKTDYKCATKYAIKLNREWNGWSAWTCGK